MLHGHSFKGRRGRFSPGFIKTEGVKMRRQECVSNERTREKKKALGKNPNETQVSNLPDKRVQSISNKNPN